MFTRALVLALAALLPLTSCGTGATPVPSETLGVAIRPPAGEIPATLGVTYHPTWPEMTAPRRAAVLDALRDAGVEWLRVDVSWAEFEPRRNERDQLRVAAFDERLAEIEARGFKVLLMFYWGPRWATGTDEMNGRPRDPREFGRAAAWAVTRWRDSIDALEIWNEPDLERFWQQRPRATRITDFAEVLLAASGEVRRVAPDLPLIAGGTSRVEVQWWRELLAVDAVPAAIDAIGIHPYTVPSDLRPDAPDTGKPWRVRHLQRLQPLVRRYDLPVWITEFGWSTSSNTADTALYERGVAEDVQARYVTQALTEFGRFPWIEAAFWYTDIDHSTGNAHQDSFGLLRRDGSPKPAYFAVRCAATGRCDP